MKETEEVSRITGGSGLSAPRQESLNLSLGREKEATGTEADLRGPLQGRSPLIVGRESPEAVPTHFGKGATPLSFLPGPQGGSVRNLMSGRGGWEQMVDSSVITAPSIPHFINPRGQHHDMAGPWEHCRGLQDSAAGPGALAPPSLA